MQAYSVVQASTATKYDGVVEVWRCGAQRRMA
ncbi:hypothetical protein OOU_Y34scaffold01164g3 [Pyricularia oryzae Y34]|uniref:Uncharacterized protein n=1 Tax=Pyricularia oryzae (strain Y34) TaxID=1143189 RepID=A0AA97PF91_PYRO3|nr:hypothetical protein OOU_Y34scaffold01164g3 [Pyricularia oryzae Y34]